MTAYSACEAVSCSSCALRAGTVDYSPDPPEPTPAGRVLICGGRPNADVVLDT